MLGRKTVAILAGAAIALVLISLPVIPRGTVTITERGLFTEAEAAGGYITVRVTASDNVGVSRVTFYIDQSYRATDSTSPYARNLDISMLAEGTHRIDVYAYDKAGNRGTDAVNFSIDNTPPSVTIIDAIWSGA